MMNMIKKISRVFFKKSAFQSTVLSSPPSYKALSLPYFPIHTHGSVHISNGIASITLTAEGDVMIRGRNIYLN